MELNQNKCKELVPHFRKGQEPLLEQCKRNKINGSDRCSLHSVMFKAKETKPPYYSWKEEQSSIR